MPSAISTRSASLEAIDAGRVGRAEVVEAAIARTEAVNPALNGLAYEAFERARAHGGGPAARPASSAASRRSSRTTSTSPGCRRCTAPTRGRRAPPSVDSEFARLYLATGLISLGKTQMSEFGFSASAEHPRLGPVRNPWNTDYTAGASSSGSGAFVAAGVVPIAHANDGGGSIRIPASCNGLVGLKPSRGRLPLDKDVRRMPMRIVTNGVVTRSVRDTAAFYREAERIWRTPKLPPIGDVTRAGQAAAADRRGDPLACSASAVPKLRELTLKSAGLLEELGHRVEHLDKPPVPASFVDDFVLYWGFLALAQVRSERRRSARPSTAPGWTT